jgi:hypothetical protein
MHHNKNAPGPGSYNTVKSAGHDAPSFSLGSRTKTTISPTKDTPGPGQYEPKEVSDTPRFTLGARTTRERFEENPGPGTYNAQEFGSIGQGKGVSLHGRIPDPKDKQNIPGPGSYVTPSSFDLNKGPTMKGRFDDKTRNYNPGPGAYEDPRSIEKGQRTGPAFSMKGRAKDPASKDTAPGPGAYQISSKSTQVGITMKSRTNTEKSM